jgi:hypothetical protein
MLKKLVNLNDLDNYFISWKLRLKNVNFIGVGSKCVA